ncbi:hypothetical protein [Marivita geojedonensis]|uniref:hypothetical protein n=1 Tax=Marivita geojedonensis TaxID=1123756 RepID=UPI000A20042F|nr:hypothetical protein [Marivita geojedonensis]PRY72468.1 hypothetical protein CLV76_1352 [Marivita geojedonensis]
MSSKTIATRLVSLPVLVAIGITPAFASTPNAVNSTLPAITDPGTVSLIYPRIAQVGGDEIGGGSNAGSPGDDNRRQIVSGPAVPVSDAQTAQIVNQLNQIQQICEFMGDEYRIACFAVNYRALAERIPARGDYAEAREVLLDTARKLDNLVRSNLDRQKPALSARIRTETGQSVPTPPMRAVQQPRVPQLNRQAASIVEEAETILLRSASSDAARAIHYQRIAAAVGSNKVLLRSS